MIAFRRTKIVATLGPASATEKVLSRLITAGVNVIRLNFSHGRHDEHGESIRAIRAISKQKGKPVAILQDLQGPKVRIGPLKNPSYPLKQNALLTIFNGPGTGTGQAFSTDYPLLFKKVQPDDAILINDGRIALRVLRISREKIHCRVVEGGILEAHKGVNVPGRDLGFSSLTIKDKRDLSFGLAQNVDYIALSMVRTADDIMAVKQILHRANKTVPVIAKLEQAIATHHLEKIMAAADGVMVARGDLGVEIPLEQVPLLQKEMIRMANQARIPVITATQMLESMVQNTRPTRAEVSDVANAIFDGTDAVMLSGETATGKYPIKSVQMMARVISAVEKKLPVMAYRLEAGLPVSEAVSQSACHLASQIDAKAIVTSTLSGGSALRLSKHRPAIPIVAFTPSTAVERRMALYWGVDPRPMSMLKNTDDILQEMAKGIASAKLAKGAFLVMVSQSPRRKRQTDRQMHTDLIKVHRMGA
ncbi:MAG: pyruvate kinase [Nitrospiria bacterium]